MSAVSSRPEECSTHPTISDIKYILQIDEETDLTKEVIAKHWEGLSLDAEPLQEFVAKHNFVCLKSPGTNAKEDLEKLAQKIITAANKYGFRLNEFSDSIRPTDLPPIVYLHSLTSQLERCDVHRAGDDQIIHMTEIGVDLNTPDLKGNTLLHYDILYSNRQFIALGVDINRVNNSGMTPLCYHVSMGRGYLVGYLIFAGADVTIADYLGNTPLHYAYQTRSKNLIAQLRSAGAKDVLNNAGQLPIDMTPDWKELYPCCVIS